MIEITNTRSGMISKLAYDEGESCMIIIFAKGGSYKYKNVPKDSFDALCNADSMGKYFHANIKGKFTDVEKL